MRRRTILASLALVPLLAGAAGAREPAEMGRKWFEELRNPATRAAALFSWEQKTADPKRPPDPDESAAENQVILVFPCPQPGMEKAWAVLWSGDWQREQEILSGLEDWAYPPHPLEQERLEKWTATMREREARGDPWQVDEPWFDGAKAFLVDENGTQLTKWFFLGCGTVADFNGDGFLDVFEVDRIHANGRFEYLDCLSIGPLDRSMPRLATWFCNFREKRRTPRSWRFALEQDADGHTHLVLVSQTGEQPIVIKWQGDRFAPSRAFPEGIHVYHETEGGTWKAADKFLQTLGVDSRGIGTDDPSDLDARLTSRDTGFPDIENPFSLPKLEGLPPREAALAIVEHNRDAIHKAQFDLDSVGEEVPLPESGWVELVNDGGGWGSEFSTTWWLKTDRAERWEVKDGLPVRGVTVPREQVAWSIAVVQELDRIRSVPKHPRIPKEKHYQGGGDDFPLERVRAVSTTPRRIAVALRYEALGFWNRIGGFYNRETSSAMAVMATSAFPNGNRTLPITLQDTALAWLDPDQVESVPPALARAGLEWLGKGARTGDSPVLARLRAHLGERSPGEQRLAELAGEIRAASVAKRVPMGREQWMAERRYNRLRVEERALEEKLTGNPRFELRRTLEEILEEILKER